MAPEAFRKAGLAAKLSQAGFNVSSVQALKEPSRWKATKLSNGVRNEGAAIAVMQQARSAITSNHQDGRIPLVLGGDCSFSPAILSGLNKVHDGDVGLMYFDGDADLTIPDPVRIFRAMTYSEHSMSADSEFFHRIAAKGRTLPGSWTPWS